MFLLVFILLIIILDIMSVLYGVDSRKATNPASREDHRYSRSLLSYNR